MGKGTNGTIATPIEREEKRRQTWDIYMSLAYLTISDVKVIVYDVYNAFNLSELQLGPNKIRVVAW